MYDKNWKSETVQGPGTPGSDFVYFFNNPQEQEVVLAFDQDGPNMKPHSCAPWNSNYNLLLYSIDDKLIQQIGVPTNLNYEALHFKFLPRGSYKLKVKNFEHTERPGDFAVSTYARDEAIELHTEDEMQGHWLFGTESDSHFIKFK